MQTSVNLQEPYSYSLVPVLVAWGLIILLTALLIYLLFFRKKETQEQEAPQPERKLVPKNFVAIRNKYLKKLDALMEQYKSGCISERDVFQELSIHVRMYVFEITGKKVQNYTLEEIRRVGIPTLQNLIHEYYEPEFAMKQFHDAERAIKKARETIEKWN